MEDNLALRTAHTLVDSYTSEDDLRIQDHQGAMDCRDCDDFLQLGMDAFHWIIRADQVLRQIMFEGKVNCDHAEIERGIRALCRRWLTPCERAERWVGLQHSRSFKLENLEKFRDCCAEMRAIVAAQDVIDEEMPPVIANLRDQAIEEHRNGQTSEFI